MSKLNLSKAQEGAIKVYGVIKEHGLLIIIGLLIVVAIRKGKIK